MDFIDKYDTSECYFRGVDGLFDVTSSLHRHQGQPNFDKACNTTDAVMRWLKNNKYIREIIKDNDNRTLAVAQHYGCPTDLIDITGDIRTAAYFATTEKIKEEHPNGCIW